MKIFKYLLPSRHWGKKGIERTTYYDPALSKALDEHTGVRDGETGVLIRLSNLVHSLILDTNPALRSSVRASYKKFDKQLEAERKKNGRKTT